MLPKTKTVVDHLKCTGDCSSVNRWWWWWLSIYLLNLEINLVLEMVADTGQDFIECVAQLACSFPPRSKWMFRKIFHPADASQCLFRQNLLRLKLMWQFVLNRVWQIVRSMFMSGSKSREAAVVKEVIITGKRWQWVTRLVCKPSFVILLA